MQTESFTATGFEELQNDFSKKEARKSRVYLKIFLKIWKDDLDKILSSLVDQRDKEYDVDDDDTDADVDINEDDSDNDMPLDE